MFLQRQEKEKPRIRVDITQNDRSILEEIKSWVGSGSIQPNNRGAKAAHLILSSRAAREFLHAVYPFLRVKRHKVSQVLALDKKIRSWTW